MGRILLFDDFNAILNNCIEVSEEDVKVRKLLNLTSKNKLTEEDLNFINSINSNIFLKAYKELNKKDIYEMDVIKDMCINEYATENLVYVDQYDDEDDIY